LESKEGERVGCSTCGDAGHPVSLECRLDTLKKHDDSEQHKKAVARKKQAEAGQASQEEDR
jgi:hypothetical protein